ncbi:MULTISPECIES: MgtC/SapB family protein [unclassified Marinovum]
MIDTQTFLLRALIAVVLGGIIGIDREIKKKPLGLRAYMLVALGSAAVCMMSINMAAKAGDDGLAFDLSRAVQGIVGGIGFLGAGAIISRNETGRLRGVASGSAIWLVGVVGIGVGFGLLLESTVIALAATLILTLVAEARDGDDYDKGK